MIHIVDTSILIRQTDFRSADRALARRATQQLTAQGHKMHTFPQCMTEFWAVATRPLAVNGLGLTPAQAELERVKLEALFPLLPDPPGWYARWVQTVNRFGVSGKQAHDARIVAAMLEQGIAPILTFNMPHFPRYAAAGIAAVDPAAVP